jgi:hypothetical protein
MAGHHLALEARRVLVRNRVHEAEMALAARVLVEAIPNGINLN